MQNKKKSKPIKKPKHNKKHNKKTEKFSKNQPAARKEQSTEQRKRIVSGNDKISKAINKNIEKVMMQRANTHKETFKYLKK